ncbi:hypothetical protein Mapa_007022 [Marchantia paleacea]|nr:hypothetical protein Mapa_007022 [Marchantia paleacea]
MSPFSPVVSVVCAKLLITPSATHSKTTTSTCKLRVILNPKLIFAPQLQLPPPPLNANPPRQTLPNLSSILLLVPFPSPPPPTPRSLTIPRHSSLSSPNQPHSPHETERLTFPDLDPRDALSLQTPSSRPLPLSSPPAQINFNRPYSRPSCSSFLLFLFSSLVLSAAQLPTRPSRIKRSLQRKRHSQRQDQQVGAAAVVRRLSRRVETRESKGEEEKYDDVQRRIGLLD